MGRDLSKVRIEVLSQLKAGVNVRLESGEVGKVVGSYMSADGLVVRVKTDPSSVVAMNVPVEEISEII